MIETIGLINLEDLSSSKGNLLAKLKDPKYPNADIFFIQNKNFFIANRRELHVYPNTNTQELFEDQFEMPMAGLGWFIYTIEVKFFKPPEEGGLPHDKFSYRDTVNGEILAVDRSFNPRGEGISGYNLHNLSRQSYIDPTWTQILQMSDEFLFESGLMDFFKDIDFKYRLRLF